MTPSDVLAVVVSYNGGDAIAPTVSALRSQGVRVHIVDNGSDAPTLAALDALAQDAGVSVELLGRNLGVGHALNRGVVKARALGATWLLTMDQDSLVDSGLVAAYARAAARHPGGVCFAPTIDDSHHGENDRDGERQLKQPAPCHGAPRAVPGRHPLTSFRIVDWDVGTNDPGAAFRGERRSDFHSAPIVSSATSRSITR